jgi:hypothetical protein
MRYGYRQMGLRRPVTEFTTGRDSPPLTGGHRNHLDTPRD